MKQPTVLMARKNRVIGLIIYRLLILPDIQRAFHKVALRISASSSSAAPHPVILFGNHSSWWDAYLALLLNERVLKRDGYVMVEDTQLERYQFFRYLGAFSVNRKNARAAVASMHYASQLLAASSNRLLLIFPQGRIMANDQRPLDFGTGIGHIARRAAPCQAYPMALRCEFIGEQKPEAFISVGPSIEVGIGGPDAKALTAQMEAALTTELDNLRADITASRFSEFRPLAMGTTSINRIWDSVRGRTQIAELGPNQHSANKPTSL